MPQESPVRSALRMLFSKYLTALVLTVGATLAAILVSFNSYIALMREDVHYELCLDSDRDENNLKLIADINMRAAELLERYSKRESSVFYIEHYYDRMSSHFVPKDGFFSVQGVMWWLFGKAKPPSREEKARIYFDLVIAPLKGCVAEINAIGIGQVEEADKIYQDRIRGAVTLKDVARALNVRQIGDMGITDEDEMRKISTLKHHFENCQHFQHALRKQMEGHFFDVSSFDDKIKVQSYLIYMKNLETNLNSAIVAINLSSIENLFETIAQVKKDLGEIVSLSESAGRLHCGSAGDDNGSSDMAPTPACATLAENSKRIAKLYENIKQRIEDLKEYNPQMNATSAPEALLRYIFKLIGIALAFTSLAAVRHIVLA